MLGHESTSGRGGWRGTNLGTPSSTQLDPQDPVAKFEFMRRW